MNDPDATSDPNENDCGGASSLEIFLGLSSSDSSEHPEQIGRYRIDKVLGRGGYGLVYLAYDDQLQRSVAIKVPHVELIAHADQAKVYLAEARTVANLDHPHIVPVYDVGSTERYPCFIVSKYIDGIDLAKKSRQSPFTVRDTVELITTVAEALHHAHKQGFVHRDIKPANILLDKNNQPFVTDFGLALREQNVSKESCFAGTPSYMSPEQARGEGHRVDARSDIFSLGVVLYELLTGRKPFQSKSIPELFELICTFEPRPPRQLNEFIPKELDRICLKAISKRASERYSTAHDLADDLGLFLKELPLSTNPSASGHLQNQSQAKPIISSDLTPPITPTSSPYSDSQPIKVVPKGLRSFDAHDADFFLELLPGPRDRGGLPESIRFWKSRIEKTDLNNPFSVGLMYGPSGCGKSSLVKAGLLPRLSEDVLIVYIEATAEQTERRLLVGLRKRCAALPETLSLKESLSALRRSQYVPSGRKLLIVLDQFEQWLHAKKEEHNTELVQALRHCDGGNVQCIVMVRDDFWMAATRFMKELEVKLVEGQNSSAVDLFDTPHATKVMTAFGRAFGTISENAGEKTKEQKEFLQQAIGGLSQEGKVISVRLALFAEMMKSRDWTPATLKKVGGTEGVGITFLEETFSAQAAPPEHRYHQKAVRSVLRALLPESGTLIKGHMKTHEELLHASGYTDQPKDFDDLIHILDSEIRLITPTDPDGVDEQNQKSERASDKKYYQLTHDFLVPSLRDWLTRKQKETRRGRAELLLEDRSGVWNACPENRQLPSLLQWFEIKWYTRKKSRTLPQRRMMRKARKYYAMRGMTDALIVIVIGLGSWEAYGRLQSLQLRNLLQVSTIAEVPGIVTHMSPFRRWVDPLLYEDYAQSKNENDPRKQLHSSLALLPVDPAQVEYLYERLLQAEPEEFDVIRKALSPHSAELTERLWKLLEKTENKEDQRLRAACALSVFVLLDPFRWNKVSGDVAAILVEQKPYVIFDWLDALLGVSNYLFRPLTDMLMDEKRSVLKRSVVAMLYQKLAVDNPLAYAQLEDRLTELTRKTEPYASKENKVILARKQACIGAALLLLSPSEKVWLLFKHSPDPTLRSFLIDRCQPMGVDPKVLIARLEKEQDVSIKRAILLSLGEHDLRSLSADLRLNQLQLLLQLYRDDPDPGIHSAAEWLLSQWQMSEKTKAIDKELATGQIQEKRQWYLNRQGQTMVVITKPGEFLIEDDDSKRQVRIDWDFAIASKEVTVDQFSQFKKGSNEQEIYAPTGECPIIGVSWYHAVEYCNWLSEQEELPKEQWCYEPNKDGLYTDGMTIPADFIHRTGYRLPTEVEWDYACRAGATTDFSFGNSEEVLGEYGWIISNSDGQTHPVGTLKANDLGFFDMHGNADEWCQNKYFVYVKEFQEDAETIKVKDIIDDSRVLRGGGFGGQVLDARCANRAFMEPSNKYGGFGIRLARTLPQNPFTVLPPAKKTEVEEFVPTIPAGSDGMKLIEIPAGKFTMGEGAGVAVTLTKSFGLGKYEVTQGQWKSVMGSEPWKGKEHVTAGKDCPATYVSWDDATEFCEKLTELEREFGKLKANEEYRLPTEAEWEYACRAGTTTAFSFGDDESKLGEYACFDENALNVGEYCPHKVGMKKPNPWGLYDMHGNVWEWCSDWSDEKLSGGSDPVGPGGGSGRVLRGGGWRIDPGYCRSASRFSDTPSDRYNDLGFRVARSQSAQ